MPKFTINIRGDNEIKEMLRQIPPGLEAQALGPALMDAGRIVLAEAKSRVPVRNGGLKRSLGVVLRKWEGGKTVVVGRVRKGGAHAHLIEFGTKPHPIPRTTGTGGKWIFQHPGSKAFPFLFPAWGARRADAVAVIRFRLSQWLDRFRRS